MNIKKRSKRENTFSRRSFLKNTAGIIGGGLLLNSLPGLAFSRDFSGSIFENFKKISGRYPHLTMFNRGNECGIGAVVPWANNLWTITYSPHDYMGNDHDGLYEITPELEMVKREESIGGTPAARLIHRESQQLFIGPYAIDKNKNVRTIPYEKMPGRHTAIARHLTNPARKVYYFTMEEGVYEVDVETLDVKTLYLDSNITPGGNDGGPRLPGYHGKGGYSGQGFVIYANDGRIGTGGVSGNGLIDFRLYGGSLSTWNGEWGGKLSSKGWQVVNDNQFTEVTGPGGIHGNENEEDPVWSVGWDHRSVLLKLLDNGKWSTFRLPKADYSYEGLHGWHVEWPRIRQVGSNGEYLMNHHGMWFDFPGNFSEQLHLAPKPIASHLKMTGDFARWQDQIVFGCDDNALSRFGTREALSGQSQSNLWFTKWDQLKDNGRPYGWGGPWVLDDVRKDEPSDPFAFPGYTNRQLHITHMNTHQITFKIEIERSGQNAWETLTTITVPPHGYVHHVFPDEIDGEWIRLSPNKNGRHVTAYFHYGKGGGLRENTSMFGSLSPANLDKSHSMGLLFPRGEDAGTLQFAAWVANNNRAEEVGYYEMNENLKLEKVDNSEQHRQVKEKAAIETEEFRVDEASVIMVDYWGNRFRLPKGDSSFDKEIEGFGIPRVRRELTTERDILNIHGTIYCLPRENSGDVANLKPVATHNKRFTDYCSWRGLVAIAGCVQDISEDEHFCKSEDGKVGLWLGDFDDLWKLGKPKGKGGPWKNTNVKSDIPSDPYLMTGYDRKKLEISHKSDAPVEFTIEVNVIMNLIAMSDEYGFYSQYKTLTVEPGERKEFHFPDGFSAHWVRLVAQKDCNATATFIYS